MYMHAAIAYHYFTPGYVFTRVMKLPVSYFNMVQIQIYHVYIITMPPSYSSLGLYPQIWDIFVFITGHIKVDFFHISQ